RIGHDALEGALSEIAGQQPDQELPLAFRGAPEELAEQPPPLRLRARPGDGPDRVERHVDVGQGKARAGGRGVRPARLVPAGGGRPGASRPAGPKRSSPLSAAYPTPICPCSISPDRKATATFTSPGGTRRSSAAICSILAPRAEVPATAADASTRSVSNTHEL